MGVTGAALLLAATLAAGEPPQVGQAGKDVGWVPTPERMVRRLLQLADVTPDDVVVDLGAGDGRIPIYAAKHFGARGIGVELEANLVEAAGKSAAAQGVANRVRFIRQDLFDADLSAATVIALYTAPAVMERLKPRLLRLRPGTRIVSHHFQLGDWFADEEVQVEGRKGYLWVVPAALAGEWSMALPGEEFQLRIRQRHQSLETSVPRITDMRLRGTEIRFFLVESGGVVRQFQGRVDGDRMSGESEGRRWSAERKRP